MQTPKVVTAEASGEWRPDLPVVTGKINRLNKSRVCAGVCCSVDTPGEMPFLSYLIDVILYSTVTAVICTGIL